MIVACPDAERPKAVSERLLPVPFDRLCASTRAWRLDERGRGLFLAKPRLDTVVIPRPEERARGLIPRPGARAEARMIVLAGA